MDWERLLLWSFAVSWIYFILWPTIQRDLGVGVDFQRCGDNPNVRGVGGGGS